MAISSHIVNLTTLALKDRVLTYTERQIIMNAAMQEGVSEQEINAYIDSALEERLQSYTKEELGRCPGCGHGVPLIADTCPFCGRTLEKQTTQQAPAPNVPPPYIPSAEAAIINQENQQTAAQKRDIKTCPDCGAPYPLVSNICPQCGHVLHEQQDSDLNIKNLIANIQQSIDELQKTPQPTVEDVLSHRKYIFTFLVSLLFLAFSILAMRSGFADTDRGMFFVIAGVSIVLLIIAIIKALNKRDKPSPADIADNKFFTALHRKEMYANQIATLYGNDSEAQEALNRLAALTETVKKRRDKRMRSLAITISLSVIGMLALIVFLLYVPGETLYNVFKNSTH